jgi:hypothetical protein
MSVDLATVKRVAHLARIAVSDDEAARMEGELNAILGFVEQFVRSRCRGRRADDLGDADGDENDARMSSPMARKPKISLQMPPKRPTISSLCPRWSSKRHGRLNCR